MYRDILSRGSEVGIVGSGRVLDGDSDGVRALSTLGAVIDLEVVRRLRESISVRKIVHGIDEVERVDAGGVQIGGDGGCLSVIVGVVEHEAGCTLGGGAGERGLVRHNVIASVNLN